MQSWFMRRRNGNIGRRPTGHNDQQPRSRMKAEMGQDYNTLRPYRFASSSKALLKGSIVSPKIILNWGPSVKTHETMECCSVLHYFSRYFMSVLIK